MPSSADDRTVVSQSSRATARPEAATLDAAHPRAESCFRSAEFGYVCPDRSLVEFLAEVFQLEELWSTEIPRGTVYRLQAPGCMLKVFVPVSPPTASPATEPFDARGGPRFITIRVVGLDGVLERAVARGAHVLSAPAQAGRGVRFAIFHHPYGGTIEIVEGDTAPRVAADR